MGEIGSSNSVKGTEKSSAIPSAFPEKK